MQGFWCVFLLWRSENICQTVKTGGGGLRKAQDEILTSFNGSALPFFKICATHESEVNVCCRVPFFPVSQYLSWFVSLPDFWIGSFYWEDLNSPLLKRGRLIPYNRTSSYRSSNLGIISPKLVKMRRSLCFRCIGLVSRFISQTLNTHSQPFPPAGITFFIIILVNHVLLWLMMKFLYLFICTETAAKYFSLLW